VLSADIGGGHTRDGVNLIFIGQSDANGRPINVTSPNEVLTAQLSDNNSVMAAAKYSVDRLTVYAGYEWTSFADPSDPQQSFTDIAGTLICAGCGTVNFTNINNTAFSFRNKVLQLAWTGLRYSVTSSIDVVAAYYHQQQNDYTSLDCTVPAAHAQCAGSEDTVSALLIWRLAPKWDTYIGTQYTQSNGGMNSGYLKSNNATSTVGVRFRW